MSDLSSAPEQHSRIDQLESTIAQLSQQVSSLTEQIETMQLYSSDFFRFGRLQQLLAEGQWQQADLETSAIMLEISGHPTIETLTPQDIQKFPCHAIRIIDQLWSKYSSGRFGFRVKMRIYQEIGGTVDSLRSQDKAIILKMREKIGAIQGDRRLNWEEQNFSLSAPEGALPSHWYHSPYGDKMICFFCLRLLDCGICQGK
jgi:regulator of replication initiation timing